MSIATAVASNIDVAGNVASQRFSVGARATTLLLRLLDGETDASTVVAWSGEEADGLADAIGARSWPAATAKRLLQICVALQRPAHTLLWTRVVRRWSLADASSRDKISCNVYVQLNLHALQTIRSPFSLSLSLSVAISFRLSHLFSSLSSLTLQVRHPRGTLRAQRRGISAAGNVDSSCDCCDGRARLASICYSPTVCRAVCRACIGADRGC